MTLPMLADFAIRLAGGLAAVLAVTPWRVVPIRFFRTQGQVILGLGVPASVAVAGVAAVALGLTADGGPAGRWALNAASRLASAALLGSTLTAMLLGHYYLTAPAMSIEPLKRFVRLMAASLAVRSA